MNEIDFSNKFAISQNQITPKYVPMFILIIDLFTNTLFCPMVIKNTVFIGLKHVRLK